jgi:hypothetical protein
MFQWKWALSLSRDKTVNSQVKQMVKDNLHVSVVD